MSALSLTTEQQSLFDYIDSIIPGNGHLEYDFRDPRQFQFANMLNELGGRSQSNYPGAYRLLADIKDHQHKNGYQPQLIADDPADPWSTGFDVVGVGHVEGQTIAASNGQGTVVGGFNSMNLALYVRDNTTGNLLAVGTNESFLPGTLLSIQTDDSSAAQDTGNTTAYLSYGYQPTTSSIKDAAGAPGGSGVVTKRSPDGPVSDPVVIQPVRTATAPPYNPLAINIGLARAWTDANTNLDYWWNEPVQAHPVGKVPFVGSVTFAKPIATLNPTVNFNLTIKVSNTTGGGTSQILPANMTPVYAGFSINPNNTSMLQWNLPAGTQSFPLGNPIVFTSIPWVTDLLAYLTCYIMVTFTDGTNGFATISSSNVADDDPLDGTTYIMPLEFIWHCLAGGTQVLMNTGETKAIENIIAGDIVRTDNSGSTANVRATTRGLHLGSVVKFTTDKGHELTSTDHHAIFTSKGLLDAHELKKGDEIIVAGGNATVISVEVLENYQGLFHNLAVDNGSAGNADDEIGAFFGNGIQVGDAYAQRSLKAQRAADKEWIKAQLGDYWATDIESHFSKK